MMNKAAIALANSLSAEELANGSVYPSIDRIRDVTLEVATAGIFLFTFLLLIM